MKEKWKQVGVVAIDLIALFVVTEWFLYFIGIEMFTKETRTLLDWALIGILAIDYMVRLSQAEHKKSFLKHSWYDLIALIPFIPILRLFRMVRILKMPRIKRACRLIHGILTTNALAYVILGVIILACIGGGLLYRFEGPDRIPTLADGIWFSVVTMTTVGYGDFVPVTSTGRWISIFLMLVGVGFLGVLTSAITTFFTRRVKSRTQKSQIQSKESVQISSQQAVNSETSIHTNSTIKKEQDQPRSVDISHLSVQHQREVRSFVQYLEQKEHVE